MKMITSKDVTMEHIKKVNFELGFEETENVLSNYGYAFYYNHMFVNGIDRCDVDRYANLNTIFGYDIGVENFGSLDEWLWENNFDLMELSGNEDDKELVQEAMKKQNVKGLDFSKWKNLSGCKYSYSYFEDGNEYK